ncbi:MAG TPA: hypothetical protein VGO11_21615 [Chthoniobacteraceae bacterium]|jgi:hypothetical protein|nr:hypothetical protein [Chthoniobacteraceae bacterium]
MADMETPDPSPLPDPAAREAAGAAMRREWEELRAQIVEWNKELPEEEKPEDARRRTALLRDFFARHRPALLAAGVQNEQLDLTELEADLARFLHSDASYHDAEEKLLQMTAIKAEQEQALTVTLLGHLESLEKIPPEEWDAMTDDEREQLETTLAHFRQNREAMLGVLPIALRHEWERRLGPQ